MGLMRFPLELPFSYAVRHRGILKREGRGQTIELSSKAVSFEIFGSVFAIGDSLELDIEWPATLDNGTPLTFVVKVRVIDAIIPRYSALITHYSFKTRGRKTLRAKA